MLDVERLRWRAVTTRITGEFSTSTPPPPCSFQGSCALPLPSVAEDATVSQILVLGNLPTASHIAAAAGSLMGRLMGSAEQKSPGALEAYTLELKSMEWLRLEVETETGMEQPCARSGHSATVIDGCVWVFGGEDQLRRPLADVHVLHLATLRWIRNKTHGEVPEPRSGHTATAYSDRYLLVFGGSSHSQCLPNQLYILDTLSREWMQRSTEGAVPRPRSGHVAALMDDVWYIIGGGDNTSAVKDVLALRLAGNPAVDTLRWVELDEPAPSGEYASLGLSIEAGGTGDLWDYFGLSQQAVQLQPDMQTDHMDDTPALT
ncbi:hypothetical protein CYMTET_28776 [Cymbomonas tetramitiformis]|uniref:Uncharacterized protein n=1 Tax=Cymbomonas tetramitiformis TaxID=36881 RepID=A0AAE0FM91_9CHLO|nr:hypothetical protein CYMTET_28776 [Cymbomonas tetramitiformis]